MRAPGDAIVNWSRSPGRRWPDSVNRSVSHQWMTSCVPWSLCRRGRRRPAPAAEFTWDVFGEAVVVSMRVLWPARGWVDMAFRPAAEVLEEGQQEREEFLAGMGEFVQCAVAVGGVADEAVLLE